MHIEPFKRRAGDKKLWVISTTYNVTECIDTLQMLDTEVVYYCAAGIIDEAFNLMI